MMPDRRFRPEPMSALDAIQWLKTHRYVWYQAPMDYRVSRLSCTSALKLWTRSPERFAVSVWTPDGIIRIDNGHLDRLRLPFELWHHGISARLEHIRYVGHPRQIVMRQSNGFYLHMTVSAAVATCRRSGMKLTVETRRNGKRLTRVLVPEHPPISGESNSWGRL